MGTFIAALKSTEGILSTKMMKLLLLTCLAAVAIAEPYYGYYGHQLQWPSVRAPGFSATCWGCRGKRSADAEPEAEADAYYGYPYYGYGYGYRTPGYGYTHVHRFGKRSAEPEPFYGYYVTTLTLTLMDPVSLDTPEVPLLTPKEAPKVFVAKGPLNPNLITDTHTMVMVSLVTVTDMVFQDTAMLTLLN